MAKPRIPNQRKQYQGLNVRLQKYMAMVEQVYSALNLEAAKIALLSGYSENSDVPFSFAKYPQTKKRIADLQAQFVLDLSTLIYSGTTEEWKNSNEVQDLLVNNVLKSYGATINKQKYNILYQTNSDALKAFQNRTDKGLNVSAKLWKQSVIYHDSLEAAISSGIQKGISAITLSKRISKYLHEFPQLQKDYKEKFGKAANIYDCEYRSMRLVRSEINMAYRKAESERWKQMDFVVGYEIKLSGKHHRHDICDELKGKYPKYIEWTGWHPNDMCYKVPILKTEDEFWEWDGRSEQSEDSVNAVTDVPDGFKWWVLNNQDRIKDAKARGTLPYFLRDNIDVVNDIIANKKQFYNSQYVLYPNKSDVSSVSQVFQLSSDDYKVLISEQGVNSFNLDDYNSSAMRGFNLKTFDRLIEDIADQNEISLESKKVDILNNGNVQLIFKGHYGDEDFALKRTFRERDGKRVVYHDLFELPVDLQGKGISKKIFRELFEQYEAMEIDSVDVYANLDIGGYTWGRYGFKAGKNDVLDIITDAYKRRFNTLTKEEYDEVMNIVSMFDDYVPMNLLANLDYGKKLLLNSGWFGKIDLKDINQMVYLKDYLSLQKQQNV